MDKEQSRRYFYALMSRVFSDILDFKTIEQLRENSELLEILGPDTVTFFEANSDSGLEELLNIDFTTMFLMNTHPVESAIYDNSKDIVTGMENLVMQFYMDHGYEVNMNGTHLMAPDHISVELGFMQNAITKENFEVQYKFSKAHLMSWIPSFLIACEEMADTPFYRDFCNFAVEFIVSDFSYIKESLPLKTEDNQV
jgi:TorA maturation chaperone TorD